MSLTSFIKENDDSGFFVITEGLGQVKKQYLQRGTIDIHDYNAIEAFLKHMKYKNDYSEWLTRMLIAHDYVKKNTPRYFERTEFLKSLAQSVLTPYEELKNKGFKKPLPEKKSLKELERFIDKITEDFYRNKISKFKNIKEGTDYERVYRKGSLEIFKVITHEAMKEMGAGTKWCVAMCDDGEGHWNTYLQEGVRFYVIRDHSRSTDDNFYKVAVEVTKSTTRFWDAKDNSTYDYEVKEGVDMKTIYDFPWFEHAVWEPEYEMDDLLYNKSYSMLSSEEKDYFESQVNEFISAYYIEACDDVYDFETAGDYFTIIFDLEKHTGFEKFYSPKSKIDYATFIEILKQEYIYAPEYDDIFEYHGKYITQENMDKIFLADAMGKDKDYKRKVLSAFDESIEFEDEKLLDYAETVIGDGGWRLKDKKIRLELHVSSDTEILYKFAQRIYRDDACFFEDYDIPTEYKVEFEEIIEEWYVDVDYEKFNELLSKAFN
jgi:hypothetical protein